MGGGKFVARGSSLVARFFIRRYSIPKLKKRICTNCYFSGFFEDALHCLKNPPGFDAKTGLARWPIVDKNAICGQFRYAEMVFSDFFEQLFI